MAVYSMAMHPLIIRTFGGETEQGSEVCLYHRLQKTALNVLVEWSKCLFVASLMDTGLRCVGYAVSCTHPCDDPFLLVNLVSLAGMGGYFLGGKASHF